MHLLDTNICIYHLKGTYPALIKRMEAHSPANIAVPSIVKAELYYGANKSQNQEKTIQILNAFLAPFPVIAFGGEEAFFYARIRAEMESKGQPIGPNDLLIASTAMARGAILVTHNFREFQKVRGLVWEDWTE